jgi:hypothetical protein
MDQFFQLPVAYKQQQLHFQTNLVRYGYSYRFNVDINGTNVFFEPDEEGGYRAIVESQDKKIDIDLLEEISIALASLHENIKNYAS